MKGLRAGLFLMFLGVLLLPCGAFAIGLEAAVGLWNQDPRGYVSLEEKSPADRLSLENDLRYGRMTRIFGRMKIETPFGFPNIYLMATPMSFEATGSKGTPFNIGGFTVPANVPFNSKLDLDHYDAGFYYGLPFVKTATAGVLNVDLGILARLIDFKLELNESSVGAVTSKKRLIPLPMAYAAVQVKPLSWLSAEGEVRGILYNYNHYYDLIGRAKVNPFGPVFLAAGYRYEKVKVDQDGIRVEANFGGPFGEVGVEF